MKSVPFKLAALAMTCGIGLAQAQTTPLEFKFASSAPPTSPWAKQIDRSAAQVAEETKGAVKITPFYGSQLGSENDAIAQISRGRIEMGTFTLGAVALRSLTLESAVRGTAEMQVNNDGARLWNRAPRGRSCADRRRVQAGAWARGQVPSGVKNLLKPFLRSPASNCRSLVQRSASSSKARAT